MESRASLRSLYLSSSKTRLAIGLLDLTWANGLSLSCYGVPYSNSKRQRVAGQLNTELESFLALSRFLQGRTSHVSL